MPKLIVVSGSAAVTDNRIAFFPYGRGNYFSLKTTSNESSNIVVTTGGKLFSIEGGTLTWYDNAASNANEKNQLNANGKSYYWIALG